jgi:dTDP-4-amino-4,6-dideoxygalactose transaminase
MVDEKNIVYNPWPNGQVPKELQRPELEQIKELGFTFNDAREVLTLFEDKVAAFAGCKYAIAVDCCTHALELSLRYLLSIGEIKKRVVGIPVHTYISVPMMLNQLNFKINYHQEPWTGLYQLKGTRVYDSAVRWMERMFIGGDALQCLSFQIKKRIPIGRGGMILTNDEQAANWLRLARYDGRDMSLPYDHPDHVKMQGYHYYMTPEDAARGLILMNQIPGGSDTGNDTTYPNVQKMLEGL